jgi:hypothetical protein
MTHQDTKDIKEEIPEAALRRFGFVSFLLDGLVLSDSNRDSRPATPVELFTIRGS